MINDHQRYRDYRHTQNGPQESRRILLQEEERKPQQFKNRGGSRKTQEYEKLFQQANSLGAPLVPEFVALFENYNK